MSRDTHVSLNDRGVLVPGTDIWLSNKIEYNEYMKRNNLVCLGDDHKSHFANKKKQQEREGSRKFKESFDNAYRKTKWGSQRRSHSEKWGGKKAIEKTINLM